MAFFTGLDHNSDITDITFNDRKKLGPLDKASHEIMRGKSAFTPKDREIMAAYVSGLNACQFCYGAHVAVADQFGISENLIKELLENIDSSSIDDKLKPIFHYLRKLTLEAHKITEKDVQLVLDKGWTEAALHDAILVGCLFNFYNRLLDGHGVKGNPSLFQIGGKHLYKNGYKVPWFITYIKGVIKKKKMKLIETMESID